ncbi:multidrug effflux MFS transporter [Spelaeicoccus albus]|uniref:DHA1 family bicyclomycin/chloramphenicol resistance-like MFS transporter n=1 Tax=Spelaeicoccus albus TaxID=1280376 RepID=A0A7Z0AB59_9MICO|nr:multidrug effflux MFS transporter [Spelaeicoccus albus]NYI66900.1 DHA1 family bicyclomycin/chloramphenicol resistance-like MFS transporter [Spelaeicoccus albus]
MAPPASSEPSRSKDPTRGLGLVGLVLLSAIGPMATDVYLPSLPDVVGDLNTSASAVQLTLSGFMLGLAFGQLLIGAISDALGRRKLIIIGEVICLLSTIGCALAPTISLFIAARVVQGFSGAAGVVLARAIITDVTTGARTTKLIAALMAIVGIAPVVAPLIGALLNSLGGWRSVFWALAAVMAVTLIIIVGRIRETLPADRRRPSGATTMVKGLGTALGRRLYLGYLLSFALAFGAFFSYISASSFILQAQHGFSPLAYGVTFALGSLVLTASVTTTGRLAGKVPQQRLMTFGMGGLLAAGVIMLTASLTGMPLWLFLVGIAVLTMSMGQIMPNATTLALAQTRDMGGTGSALIGFSQFILAAAVSPLVGLAGEHDPHPFGATFAVCVGLSACACVFIAFRGERR